MSKNNKRAFSLFELSITLVIIGILATGLAKSGSIYAKYRIATAANLTQGSPVKSIGDLLAWYEPTLEDSFLEKEAQDYGKLSLNDTNLGAGLISIWHDNNSVKDFTINPTQSDLTKRPQFHLNCINDLPCLKFDGVDDFLTIPNSLDLNNSEYSIFVVEMKDSSGEIPYLFLGPDNSSSGNDAIALGFDSELNNVYYGQGSEGNRYYIKLSNSQDQPILHTFMGSFDNDLLIEKVSHRLNDLNEKSNLTGFGTPAFTKITSNGELRIGSGYAGSSEKFYKGSIGEIIIFNKSLKSNERKSVVNYLMEKWKLSNNVISLEEEEEDFSPISDEEDVS